MLLAVNPGRAEDVMRWVLRKVARELRAMGTWWREVEGQYTHDIAFAGCYPPGEPSDRYDEVDAQQALIEEGEAMEARRTALRAAWDRANSPHEVEVRRCTGHCCKAYVLPFDPPALARAAAVAAGEVEPAPDESLFNDVEQIAAMSTYIGAFTSGTWPAALDPDGYAVEARERGWVPDNPDALVHWYSCKNLQANGDCGVYDTRPGMCRGYPYGRPCLYGACSRTCRPETPAEVTAREELADREWNEQVKPGLEVFVADTLAQDFDASTGAP